MIHILSPQLEDGLKISDVFHPLPWFVYHLKVIVEFLRLILRAINQSIVLQYNGISGKYKHFRAEKA